MKGIGMNDNNKFNVLIPSESAAEMAILAESPKWKTLGFDPGIEDQTARYLEVVGRPDIILLDHDLSDLDDVFEKLDRRLATALAVDLKTVGEWWLEGHEGKLWVGIKKLRRRRILRAQARARKRRRGWA